MRVVIWDVDDVLNDLMRAWFEEWWRPRHPECTLSYEDLVKNPPHSVLGVSEGDYLASLDAFRVARFDALAPRADTLQWFAEHGGRAEHIALTAVPEALAHLSASWVVGHFGRWIRTFAFVPSRRGDRSAVERFASKADYLGWLGRGDVFVDDREENVEAARARGLTGVVVPRPWNSSSHLPFGAALANVAGLL